MGGETVWIGVATIVLAIVGATWTASWTLSGKITSSRDTALKQLGEIQVANKKETDELWSRLNGFDRDFRGLLDIFSARAAEPIHALREKIANMEIESHKHFVSQREYEKDYERILLEIKAIRDAMEKRFDTFDLKLDKLVKNDNHHG